MIQVFQNLFFIAKKAPRNWERNSSLNQLKSIFWCYVSKLPHFWRFMRCSVYEVRIQKVLKWNNWATSGIFYFIYLFVYCKSQIYGKISKRTWDIWLKDTHLSVTQIRTQREFDHQPNHIIDLCWFFLFFSWAFFG